MAPPGLVFSMQSVMGLPDEDLVISEVASGTLMMTPFPVPSQRRVQETRSAVMRTKENPSLPVPGGKRVNQVRGRWEGAGGEREEKMVKLCHCPAAACIAQNIQ